MNFNLFGQTLLTVVAIVSATLTCYLIMQMKKKQQVPNLLGVSILLAVLIQLAIAFYLNSSEDELPSQLWLMIAPWIFSLALVYGVKQVRGHTKMSKKRRKRTRLIYIPVGVNVLCCLLLSSILLNNYYHYYPTFYSMIGKNQSLQAALDKNGQVILQYSADGKPLAPNNSTLENSLYGKTTGSTSGRLFSVAIPGTASKFHARNAWVYVPAIASTDPNALNLPVLVLLAGYPGAPTDWLHGVNLVNTLNAFAKQHHGITPIVVVPDDTGSQFNDTECVNSPRGNVETYLTEDVPNYIEAHFPASNNPANWAVGGLSMGGTCAVMLGLGHPHTYETFLDMSGESGPSLDSEAQTIQVLFHGSYKDWQEHQPLYLLAHKQYPNSAGFFASGNADSPDTIDETKQLYQASKQAGLDAAYETVQGPHSFNVFEQIFSDALPWLSNRVGATSCTSSSTCS